MRVTRLEIPGLLLLVAERHEDERGFFMEAWNRKTMAAAGIEADFVQDNHVHSRRKGTVRGLHYQLPPFAQDKLVRVVRGRILDVCVDVRAGSPTFGRHVALELAAHRPALLWVPRGLAHGYCTLEDDTEVLYKVTDYYAPSHEAGLRWNDPALGIAWPVSERNAILSERDAAWPGLAAAKPCPAPACPVE
jgi:dTDP-4-dehydrorhamnose 3,5-epimerase